MPRIVKGFISTAIVFFNALVVDASQLDDPYFVGAEQCQSCHQQQYQDWLGSHHDQAMKHANSTTVLGNFDNTRFDYNGITSQFYKKGDEFWVTTDGADGALQAFKIAYTFGVNPLQQYLVAFDDGRLQALSIAWDSRTKEQGGQRWFHLYPDEKVDHKDVLHWTRYANNWNSRCAECHSTNLQKNYQQKTNSYQTTWSEINVACESCHGPGADHIVWSKTADQRVVGKGLVNDLSISAHWQRAEGMATATNKKVSGNPGDRQVNACAGCHSRRGTIHYPTAQDSSMGKSTALLDRHMPRWIEAPLYHADGQILDEVYVYGSFTQSKMYQRGVVCSNCHNPHSLKLKAGGNQVCAQCHSTNTFDNESHHHHPQGSEGAQCVNCHMPETTYMVVDPRRDHSIRVPRPDLSVKLGVPNACNRCHQGQSVDWAAEQFQRWYPAVDASHYGELFDAVQKGAMQGLPALAALANDDSQPLMVRASAVQKLSHYPDQYAINNAIVQLQSTEAQLRLAALESLAALDERQRLTHLWPLLSDPVRAVRLEATRLLAGVGLSRSKEVALGAKKQAQLDQAVAEYIKAASYNADAPTGQLQLGVLYLALNQPGKALAAYQHALVLEPDYIPALLNIADLYRSQGQDHQALPLLERALVLDADNVAANFALGLLKIRQRQLDAAINYLRLAALNAPDISRYSYVYSVALFEAGKQDQAISMLKQTLARHPADSNVISALVSYLSAMGRSAEAKNYADQLAPAH